MFDRGSLSHKAVGKVNRLASESKSGGSLKVDKEIGPPTQQFICTLQFNDFFFLVDRWKHIIEEKTSFSKLFKVEL